MDALPVSTHPNVGIKMNLWISRQLFFLKELIKKVNL
jgi:hypothetical protein